MSIIANAPEKKVAAKKSAAKKVFIISVNYEARILVPDENDPTKEVIITKKGWETFELLSKPASLAEIKEQTQLVLKREKDYNVQVFTMFIISHTFEL